MLAWTGKLNGIYRAMVQLYTHNLYAAYVRTYVCIKVYAEIMKVCIM